jgi:hypothetical protein
VNKMATRKAVLPEIWHADVPNTPFQEGEVDVVEPGESCAKHAERVLSVKLLGRGKLVWLRSYAYHILHHRQVL